MINNIIKQLEDTRDRIIHIQKKLYKYNHILNLPDFALKGYSSKAGDITTILKQDLKGIALDPANQGTIANLRHYLQGLKEQLDKSEELINLRVEQHTLGDNK